MLRITPKTDIIQSYIEMANTLITAPTIEEVRHHITALTQLLGKLTADEKRKSSPKLRCQIDVVTTHLLLCDMRRMMLGAMLTVEEGKQFDVRSAQLNEWMINSKHDDPIYFYMAIICKTANVVKVEDEIQSISNIIIPSFYLLVLIQKIKPLKKDNQLGQALTILYEDRQPKTDAEVFLYRLIKMAISKLFTVREHLANKQAKHGDLSLQDRNYMTFIDAVLAHHNLHEYPMCRAKYSLHAAKYKLLSDNIDTEQSIENWRYVKLGCLAREDDKPAFAQAVQALLAAFDVVNEMYQKYLALLLTGRNVKDMRDTIITATSYLRLDAYYLNELVKLHGSDVPGARLISVIHSSAYLMEHRISGSRKPAYTASDKNVYLSSRFDVYNTRVKFEKMTGAAVAQEVADLLRTEHAEKVAVIEYYLLALVSTERSPDKQRDILANKKVCDDICAVIRAFPDELMRNFYAQTLHMLMVGHEAREEVQDQAHALKYCEARLAIINDKSFQTSLYLTEFYLEVLKLKLAKITNDEFKERVTACLNQINVHYDKMYFRMFEVTKKLTDPKRLGELVMIDNDDMQPVEFQSGVTAKSVNPREILDKCFELANATLTINNNDMLLSLYDDYVNLPWRQPLLLDQELANESSEIKIRLRQMRYLLRLLFNTKLKRDEQECNAIAEYLSTIHVDTQQNGLIYMLGHYIKLTARISNSFYEENYRKSLVIFKSIVDLWHKLTMNKHKLTFTYCNSFPNEYCQEMLNGSSRTLQIFNNRITIALVQRMLVFRQRLLADLSKTEKLEARGDVQRTLISVDVLLTRMTLESFTDVQQQLKSHIANKPLASCEAVLASNSRMNPGLPRIVTALSYGRLTPAQIQLSLKILSEKLIIAEFAFNTIYYFDKLPYINKPEQTSYCASLLFDILFDLEMLQADIEYWLKQGKLTAAEVNYAELIRLSVSNYASCAGLLSKEHVKGIKTYDVNKIKFDGYFSSACSQSLSLLLCEKVNLRLQAGDKRALVIAEMSETLAYLLGQVEACPESAKTAAKRAIMQYYLFCHYVVKSDELPFIQMHFDSVASLFSDDVHSHYLQVMLKFTGEEKTGDALKYVMIDGYVNLVTLLSLLEGDFGRLTLSAWERPRFLELLHKSSKYVMSNQHDEELAQLDMTLINKYIAWNGNDATQGANDFIGYYVATTDGQKCADISNPQEAKKAKKKKSSSKPVAEKPVVNLQRVKMLLRTEVHANNMRNIEEIKAVATNSEEAFVVLPKTLRAELVKIPKKPIPSTVRGGTLDMYKHLVGSRTVKDTLIRKRVNPFHVMLKDFKFNVTRLQQELLQFLLSQQIGAYVFGDALVSALYEKPGKSLSLLCLHHRDDMADRLAESQLGEQLVVIRGTNKLKLAFKNPNRVSDCRITLHFSTESDTEAAMKQICLQECFNTTFFYELATGSVIDVTQRNFHQVIVYPKVHFNAVSTVSPCIEINDNWRSSHLLPAEIILRTFSYLVRFSDNTLTVGAMRLHGFILEHLHTLLTSPKLSLTYFDDIFIVKQGRMAINWLHYYSATRFLFPNLKSEYMSDFYKACEEIDRSSARINDMRAAFFVTLLHNSFVSCIPNWDFLLPNGRERFKEALTYYLSHTIFAIADATELRDDICHKVWNRYVSDLVNMQYQVFIKLRKGETYATHEKKQFVADYCEHMQKSEINPEAIAVVANHLWKHHVAMKASMVLRK